MSQAELSTWLESRDAHWCSQYQAAPAPDEESEIVAQFLAAPYPYQNDDGGEEQEQKRQHHKLGEISATSSTYWPDEPGHVSDPGTGACDYWPSNGDASNSNSSGSGAYFDGSGCCYYYLAEPDVSLGINTRTVLPCASSIDLNLLGDGEEEGAASLVHTVPPNPSPADHSHTASHRNVGDDSAAARAAVSAPKRKAQAGNDGGDLGRHKKKEKKTASKAAQKCSQESAQSKGSCSADESMPNCSAVNRRSGAHGGNVKARAAKGSATDPQSLYARRRRERINERLKILQKLVPNGTKVDISTMLEEAVHYVRFLQQQIKMLSSDEMWMYAPIAYNGMSLGIDLRISTPQ
ncbi:hypothetical protein SETIT_9G080400v2 [Setaria italica]|uniref:BHLH domain-containing protein n=1 Tax=Setaria italica TaxID=4555 RepID=K4ALE0_SETIT|nr:transcription factor bHLH85 [Setaria italica]RCV40754.1 hypothetical protein SETIT_9G080400v2 [Setaria italica]